MRLNLYEIIDRPGGICPFSYALDVSGLVTPQISAVSPLRVDGQVKNRAGILELSATARADMTCVCDRCARAYPIHAAFPINVRLAESGEESGEVFLLKAGGFLELDEVLNTAFVLYLPAKFLCGEDCRGLCPKCGADLNSGPCGCGRDIDLRWAALGGLLED